MNNFCLKLHFALCILNFLYNNILKHHWHLLKVWQMTGRACLCTTVWRTVVRGKVIITFFCWAGIFSFLHIVEWMRTDTITTFLYSKRMQHMWEIVSIKKFCIQRLFGLNIFCIISFMKSFQVSFIEQILEQMKTYELLSMNGRIFIYFYQRHSYVFCEIVYNWKNWIRKNDFQQITIPSTGSNLNY